MSDEQNCPRCNAPFLYFTQINTRVFYCGSDTQIPSMACRYASQLQDRIKQLEEALDTLTLVVGLTPIKGNLAALQEAMDQSRAVLKAKEANP